MSNNYLSPKAETRNSHIEGQGTYAKTIIKKGELIAAFGGTIVNDKGYEEIPEESQDLFLTIFDDLYIGPRNQEVTGDGDYVNHSCEPNAGLNGQIFLVAMRDIQKEEEICFDYAMVLSDPRFIMECQCNKQECRKKVTGNDWKKSALQKKYNGYFSFYLQKKIDLLKNK